VTIEQRFKALWDETLDSELDNERSGSYQPEEFYVSGRKSKEWPEKENPFWWQAKGPGFVKSWEVWRDNSGLDIWTTPDGEPAIELEVRAERGDVSILCFIDRVFVDPNGVLYIVDLKSGSQTPAWPQQLAFNNLGLFATTGYRAQYGGFWSARNGGIKGNVEAGDGFADLRIYDDEWLWEQARMAKAIRDQQLFVAQPTNLCRSACGVAPYCKAIGGPLSLSLD
jgi:hypothetical protein